MDAFQSGCPQHSTTLSQAKSVMGVGHEDGGHSHFQGSEKENARMREIYRTRVQEAADLEAGVSVSAAYRT